MSKASSKNLKNADPEKRNKRGGVSGVQKAWDKIGRLRRSKDIESYPDRLMDAVANWIDAGLAEGDPVIFEMVRRSPGIGPKGMQLEPLEN
jgi:hypothetical protein